MEIIAISTQPPYDRALDSLAPSASRSFFRRRVAAETAVLFVTPVYDRSVRVVSKNAIDIGAHPYGGNVWVGTPGGIVCVAPEAIGGLGGDHHLRRSPRLLDVPVLRRPDGSTASHPGSDGPSCPPGYCRMIEIRSSE